MNRPRYLLGLLAALLAGCPFIGGARAYTAEAVADGDALLRTTNVRYSAGEVTGGDLALVQYFVLDMKYRAGQVTRAAFCPSAKPYLTTIANDPEAANGKAGEAATWREAIAAMTSSSAGCDRAVSAADAWVYGEAQSPAGDVKSAEERVKSFEQRVDMGTAAVGDLEQAKFDLLTARHDGKRITDK